MESPFRESTQDAARPPCTLPVEFSTLFPCVQTTLSIRCGMFKKIRNELAGIREEMLNLGEWLEVVAKAIREGSEGGGDPDRLSALEGRIEAVTGRVEAGLVEMGALKAASRAAEDRERGHRKRAEASLELARELEGGQEVDSFEAVGRAYADLVDSGDDPPSEGVQGVSLGVENGITGRARARAAKRR